MRPHYEDEILFQFVAGTSPIGEEIDSHVESCASCARVVDEHRHLIDTLRTPEVWQHAEEPTPAQKCRIEEIVAVSRLIQQENDKAEALVNRLLSGPSAWWKTRLANMPEARSAGMVRQLLARMDGKTERSPVQAIEITGLAVTIAEDLDISSYAGDMVISLRAHAWREHAFVLMYTGNFPRALEAVDHAERLFQQTAVPQYELARVRLVRSMIYGGLERLSEAIDLACASARTFLEFGDRQRYARARLVEAMMLYDLGSFPEALEIYLSIHGEGSVASEVEEAKLVQNIGECYRRLGRFEPAVTYLSKAIACFDELGLETERIRTRWSLGSMLATNGRPGEALPLLRQAYRDFEKNQMDSDAALVGLEMAEVLLVLGQPEEVPAICRNLLDRFTRAGMTSRAITGLAFLREAVALGQATPSLIRHVHDFLRKLPGEPKRMYASPFPARLDE